MALRGTEGILIAQEFENIQVYLVGSNDAGICTIPEFVPIQM